MEFRNHLPVVYLETQSHNLYVEDPDDVRLYRTSLRKLRDISLDEGSSRELLARLSNDYDVPVNRDGVAEAEVSCPWLSPLSGGCSQLGEYRVREARPRVDGPLAEGAVRESHACDTGVRVDPQERA